MPRAGVARVNSGTSKGRNFHRRDIEKFAGQLGLSADDLDASDYSDRTRQRHQPLILKFYGYLAVDQKTRVFIAAEVAAMVRSQLTPRLIFWRCVDLLHQQKVQVPNYFRLADLALIEGLYHRLQPVLDALDLTFMMGVASPPIMKDTMAMCGRTMTGIGFSGSWYRWR